MSWQQLKLSLFVLVTVKAACHERADRAKFTLVGIFPVHSYRLDKCDELLPMFVLQVEAMLVALDEVNKGVLSGSGITLDAHFVDSCENGVLGSRKSLQLIMCPEGRSICGSLANSNIIGFTGTITSDTSTKLEDTAKHMCYPVISAYATSTELDRNTTDLEGSFFYRTVPSDRYQAKAVYELLRRQNWTVFSLVWESNSYGTDLHKRLKEFVESDSGFEDICIEHDIEMMPANKDNDVETDHKNSVSPERAALKALMGKPRVIVMFTDISTAKRFFKAAAILGNRDRNASLENFQLIATDGISRSDTAADSADGHIKNLITIEYYSTSWPRFKQHVNNELTFHYVKQNKSGNPWLWELFQKQKKCSFMESATDQRRLCNEYVDPKLTSSNVALGRAHYTFEAVSTYAHAIRQVYDRLCKENKDHCDSRLTNATGHDIIKEFSSTKVHYPNNASFSFLGNSGPPIYDYFQFRPLAKSSQNRWVHIGTYDELNGGLLLMNNHLRPMKSWLQRMVTKSIAECKKTCSAVQPEQRNWTTSRPHCCYYCEPCKSRHDFVNKTSKSEEYCDECKLYEISDSRSHFHKCIPDPGVIYGCLQRTLVLVQFGCATLGLMMTVAIAVTLFYFRKTPLVTSTVTEILTTGLMAKAVLFLSPMLLFIYPSGLTCISHWVLCSLSLTIAYSCILLKTIRLLRINAHIYDILFLLLVRPKILLLAVGAFTCAELVFIALLLGLNWHHMVNLKGNFDEHLGHTRIWCPQLQETQTLIMFIIPLIMLAISTWALVRGTRPTIVFVQYEYRRLLSVCLASIFVVGIAAPLRFVQPNEIDHLIVLQAALVTMLGYALLVPHEASLVYRILFHPKQNTLDFLSRRELVDEHFQLSTNRGLRIIRPMDCNRTGSSQHIYTPRNFQPEAPRDGFSMHVFSTEHFSRL